MSNDLVARLRIEGDAKGATAAANEAGDALNKLDAESKKAAESVGLTAKEIDELEDRVRALRSSLDPAYTAQRRLDLEMAEAASLYKAGAIQGNEYVSMMAVLHQRQQLLTDSTNKATAASGLLGYEMLNMGRQFSDVGVQLALGMNPLMILIEQGPQIADIFTMAGQRGVSFGQVMAQLGSKVAPFVPALAAIGVAAGAAFGGAALAARALNKEHGNLGQAMGLTEKQMERLKDQGVSTGVTMTDVFKGTFNYLKDAAGSALKPIGDWFSKLFDDITRGVVAAMKGVVGGFVGAFDAVKATWGLLPAAIGDLAITAANKLIEGITSAINFGIRSINSFTGQANDVSKRFGGGQVFGSIAEVSSPQIANPYAGAAGKAADVASQAYADGVKKGAASVDKVLTDLGVAITKAAEARIKKAAGDATKTNAHGAHTPRDTADERSAQVDQALASAYAEELQAELAIVKDANQRADLQTQIILAQAAAKQAAVDRQIASIQDDKGLSDAKKKQLVGELRQVQAIDASVAAKQMQNAWDQAAAQTSKEALDLSTAQHQAQIDLLSSQADLSKSSYARAAVELKILDEQQQIEREKLQQITLENGYSQNAVDIAQAQLAVLDATQANARKLKEQDLSLDKALGEATDAIQAFKDAFSRRDFAGALSSLQQTIQTIQVAFQQQGLSGGLMTAGSAVGSLVGGKAGKALSTGLGIASMGASLGTMAGSLGTALSLGGSLSSLGTLGMGSMLTSIAPMLGPIGIGVGIVAGLASAFLGKKPSNHAAITQFSGTDSYTAVSSGKETSDTTSAAAQTSTAILTAEQQLKAFGASLGTTVTSIDLGTRDLTHIFLSNGQQLRSAVGDPAAAAETALKAVLQGATFTDETQQKLVDSMVAAGKGFDDISAALTAYQAAQVVSGQLADQILQLTDPEAYDKKQVTDAIKAQRDSLKAAADQGYYTADQLAKLNAQLDTLQGLQLDEVLKKYADAATSATQQLKDAADLKSSVGDQILQLTDPAAYQRKQIEDDIAAKKAQAQTLIAAGALSADFLGQLEQLRQLELAKLFSDLADGVETSAKAFADAKPKLQQWLDQLSASSSAELSPAEQRAAALQQYQAQLKLAQTGDSTALGSITQYADQLFSADRSATSSAAARRALYDQVTADIAGLTQMTGSSAATSSQANLNATLATLAANSTQQLALASSTATGGEAVSIVNLPEMGTIYGKALAEQTTALVAANDRTRTELSAQLQNLSAQMADALAKLQAAIEGGLADVSDHLAAAGALASAQLQTADQLTEQTRIQNFWLRQAQGGQ